MPNEIITFVNDVPVLTEDISYQLANFEKLAKEIKAKEDELKAKILEEMESKGIIKVDDQVNGLTITYVAPTNRETFDSKKFREDNPDLYDAYITISPVKASVRLKVK